MFARRVFASAGVFGLIVLLPQYLLEARIGRDNTSPITHPEYFYGMTGVAVAWQIAFLTVARDPIRFRPMMPAAVIEKFSFGLAAIGLQIQGRIGAAVLTFASIDLLLGVLFVVAYFRTESVT